MDKQKTISEIVFPIIKGQFNTCTENKCDKCYENGNGSCSSALTANEVEVELINAGYGNVKQAVKEFAEKLKEKTIIGCREQNKGVSFYDYGWAYLDCVLVNDIDDLITELYGADE